MTYLKLKKTQRHSKEEKDEAQSNYVAQGQIKNAEVFVLACC
jgi:hypothetical protein